MESTNGVGVRQKWQHFWDNYCKRTGKLTWRVVEPEDLPAIRRLQNISERFTGCPQRLPSLFSLPVLLALLAEDEHGKIVDVIYFEAQVEVVKMACSAAGFEESDQLQEDLVPWLRSLGFRMALATTPPKMREQMTPGLTRSGFKPLDKALSFWGRWI